MKTKPKIRLLTNNVQYRRQQTREQWIKAANAIRQGRYDYRLVTDEVWESHHKPIPIICRTCNKGFETNINHGRIVKYSSNTECKCQRPKKISTQRVPYDELLRRLFIKHGMRFEIIDAEIARLNDKIIVWCNEHALPFKTTTASLLESDNGCERCPKINAGRARKSKDFTEVIRKKINQFEKKFEGCGYTYDRVEETFIETKGRKITVTCPVHGDFPQDAYPSHWVGCAECNIRAQHDTRKKYTPQSFRHIANAITLGYYDLSEAVYITNRQHVTIKCPKHNKRTCIPAALLRGGGCSLCSAAENRWYWDRYELSGETIEDLIRRLESQ